jgi:stress response protein YsnF
MQDPSDYRNRTLVDRDGEKVGTVDDVYVDQETRKPEWVLVKTGLFGLRTTFVPMSVLETEGDTLRAPYGKDQITRAPNVGDDEHPSPEEEARLFEHYGIPYSGEGTVTAHTEATQTGSASDARTRQSEYETGSEDVQRHEEELRVDKVRRPSELVRLRKRVETEPVSTSVELEREEARVVREPVGEKEAGQGRIGEEGGVEVQLEREEPVVEKEVRPKERVRLEKDTTIEEHRVEDEVRKEQVDVERGEERR